LHDLQARGDLGKDEAGYWVEQRAVDWQQLPARVEGMVGERIRRLPATQLEIVKIASIMGEEFTAEVVARLLRADEREVVRQLSGVLDRQHQLVQSLGSQRVGEQRLSHYRFRHILFQYYLYNGIDELERAYLHEDVGQALEQLYSGHTELVAVQLARHFRAAGVVVKTVVYLQMAGHQALRGYANQDAARFFQDALVLAQTLPQTEERDRQELVICMALAGHCRPGQWPVR
jgi:predicted ATPase